MKIPMSNDDRSFAGPAVDEDLRLAALRRHAILDTPGDPRFDRIVALVQNICRAPIALVSLVDADRQWFKAKLGVDVDHTSLDTSVCALAIRQPDVFQVEDLSADPRTSAMSLVSGGPRIRFYAGAPLVTREGFALGSLCAIDTEPRPGGLDSAEAEALALLAEQVVDLIEAQHAIEDRDRALALDEARLQLRDVESRYHAIVDSAVDNAIVAMDEEGCVTSWSQGAERLFGWTEAEMLGQKADLIFTPEDRDAGIPDREISVARAEGRAADERWHLRKDGARFYAHGALTPLTGSREPGFVKAVRDVTAEHTTRAALEEARARAERITEAARLGTFDYDIVQGTLSWDDGCRALFGLSAGAPVTYAEAFLQGVHPDDRPAANAAVERSLSPEGNGVFETDYRTIGIEDGKLRYVAARGQTFFEAGRAVRLLGTVQDVTEARSAEAQLRETEQRLRFANRATNDAIWDWDLVRDHVTWNEALERAHGHLLAAVEPTGAWWIAHIHPDDRARIDASIHDLIDGGGTDWIEDYRFERADGTFADILDRGFVIRDESGRPIRMIGAMLDQTERVGIERQLRHQATNLAGQVQASEAELERLWAASPDLLVLIDAEGRYRRVNPAWTTVLGYDQDDLIGKSATELGHIKKLTDVDQAPATPAASLPTFVDCFRHKDGGHRWISWVAAPSDREVFAIGRDVTAAKEAEAVLRQTEDALRQAQKVEAVGQLTGGVAHDFNNLLTVIRGSVDLLRRPNISEERRTRYVDAIADTADRATKLTSQLLSFARRQALQPQVFDAAANVASLEGMLATLVGSRIETNYRLPDRPTPVLADPSQFDTAIVNMAVNARDAMNGEGTLTIAVDIVDTRPAVRQHPPVRGDHVAVSITDSGHGISAADIEHIFEPFFTTKGVGHGTGLGLSQVFGFAKQSSGEVIVDSEPGQGTTFTLYLPATAEQTDQGDERRAVPRTMAPGCILVVEDNKEVGAFATQALAELGHGTYLAVDADAALAELDRVPGRFDLVFTDVVMPGRSGIELAADIARLHPGLPVVLTSGYSHVLAQEGTNGFELLRKPYSIDELARVLDRAAQGRHRD
jgi:PAS domain S-box-containing protein